MQLPNGFKIPALARNGAWGTISNSWPSNASGPQEWSAGQDYPITLDINWRFDDFNFYHGAAIGDNSWIADGTGVLFVFWAVSRFDIHICRRSGTGPWSEIKKVELGMSSKERIGTTQTTVTIPSVDRTSIYEYAIYVDTLVAYHYYNLGCYVHYRDAYPGDNTFLGITNKPVSGGELCASQSTSNIQEMPDGHFSGESSRLFQLEPSSVWPELGYPIITKILGYKMYDTVATFTVTATPPLVAPLTVQLDASGSTGDGHSGMSLFQYGISSYKWNFGDGTTGTGLQTEHTYANPGTYIIKLTITTNSGATATKSYNIKIDAAAPVLTFDGAKCSWPNNINVNDNISPVLVIENQGGADIVNVTFAAEGKTGIVVSNKTVSGYGDTTINIPAHPISWYLGYTPASEEYVTVEFQLIGSNGVESDTIDYTSKIIVGSSTNPPGSILNPYLYTGGWQGAGYYDNVPGKADATYIASQTEFYAYTGDDVVAESFWDKYGKYILAAGGVAAVVSGASLLLSDKKKK